MTTKQTCSAISEMMNQYSKLLAAWTEKFGIAEGFDEWFTSQVLSTNKDK